MRHVRVSLLALLGLVIVGSFNQCDFVNSEHESSLPSSSSPAPSPEMAAGQTLYTNQCVSCHGSLATSTKYGKSAIDIANAIQNQPAMNHLAFLTPTEIADIALALGSGATPTTPSPTAPIANFKPVISNRYLLASQLQALFVADSNPTSDDSNVQGFITSLVSGHPEAFGGNCSRNDPGCVPQPCAGSSSCDGNLNTSQFADPVPSAGPVRKGYMIQACEQILAVDKAVQNLLTKAALTPVASVAPSAANITILLQFYFPGIAVDSAAVAKLTALAQAASQNSLGTTDQWRFVMLPICESTAGDLL